MFVFYSFCLFQYNDLCFWYLRFERHVNTVKWIAGTTDKNVKRVNYIDHIHTIQNTDIHTSALAPYSSSVRLLQLKTYSKKKKKEKSVFPIPSSKSDIIWDSLGRFRKHKVHFRSFQYWSFCMYIYKSVYGLMTWPLTNSFNVWLCMAMSVYRTIGIRYLHLLECTPY